MIIGYGKKKATQLVGKMLHGGDKVDVEALPEEGGDEKSQMLQGLAQEMMGALENKSSSDLAHALRSFIEELNETEEG